MTVTTNTPVGFIGLGIMGAAMAKNLLKAGFKVTVHNRSRSKVEDLLAAGATDGGSLAARVACNVITAETAHRSMRRYFVAAARRAVGKRRRLSSLPLLQSVKSFRQKFCRTVRAAVNLNL